MPVFVLKVKLDGYEEREIAVHADHLEAAKKHVADLSGSALLDGLKLPPGNYSGPRNVTGFSPS